MNSTPKFDKIFEGIMEQNVAAPGGALGDNAGAGVDLAKSSDTYAPGTYLLPKALGAVQAARMRGPSPIESLMEVDPPPRRVR